MVKEKKIIRSFAELSLLVDKTKIIDEPKEVRVEKVEKIKVEKELYDGSNIRVKGTQLITNDGNYETYSIGQHTSWRVTMIGLKNGSVDIQNDIADGYSHGSFHDRNRAASILVEMINRYKK